MANVRRVLTVGKMKDANYYPAREMARVFFPENESAITMSLTEEPKDNNCFARVKPEALNEIVCVGGGSKNLFCGYSSKDFAKLFKEQFDLSQSENKMAVKDLYLVVQVGYDDHFYSTDFAQKTANTLKKYGFKNIKLHCIAEPKFLEKDKLQVSLTPAGMLNATILSANKLGKSNFVLADQAKPRDELNRPHHTFIPDESAKGRQERIKNAVAKQPLVNRNAAIKHLISCRKNLPKGHTAELRQEVSRMLRVVISQLKRADNSNWLQVLKNGRVYFDKFHYLGEQFASSPSNVVQNRLNSLITFYQKQVDDAEISKQEFARTTAAREADLAARELKRREEQERSDRLREERLAEASALAEQKKLAEQAEEATRQQAAAAPAPVKEEEPIASIPNVDTLEKAEEGRAMLSVSSPSTSEDDAKAVEPPVASAAQLQASATPLVRSSEGVSEIVSPLHFINQPEINQRLTTLIANLTAEIAGLSAKQNRFTFFKNFEKQTKQEKLTVLTHLRDSANAADFAGILSPAMQDSRVMRSMKSSRTKQLLLDMAALPEIAQSVALAKLKK